MHSLPTCNCVLGPHPSTGGAPLCLQGWAMYPIILARLFCLFEAPTPHNQEALQGRNGIALIL